MKLPDGVTRIFINTKGTNRGNFSQEFLDFMEYIMDSTDEVAERTDSSNIKVIHEWVSRIRMSEEAGIKYMQKWEERVYDRMEGREEGRMDLNRLNQALIRDNRIDDLVRATMDLEFQEALFKEYNISA